MMLIYLSFAEIPSATANSIHIVKMCQAFAENGLRVVLITPSVSSASKTDIYSYYGVKPCFEVISLKKPLGSDYLFGLSAAMLARKNSRAVVYSRNPLGCYMAGMMGCDVLLESHAPISRSGARLEWMFRSMLRGRRLKGMVTITHALKSYYENLYGGVGDMIHVAPDGADLPAGDGVAMLKGRENVLRVGYVGHLYTGKGMEVVEQLSRQVRDADFHVVGGLEDDVTYWKTKVQYDNVFFYGHVPHADVQQYMRAFDIYLLPNQRVVLPHGAVNHEANISQYTSPLKMFEYMSHGKPIIASDLPVIREVLRDGVNSVLCSSDNYDEWVSAIRRLQSDASLRRVIGEAARDDFETRYTWKMRAKGIMTRFIASGDDCGAWPAGDASAPIS